MRKPVQLSREAREELLDAAGRYGAERAELKQQFLVAVDDALERVARYASHLAAITRPNESPVVKRVLMARFPYAVYFLELPRTLRVIAVAHEKREPRYWLSRR